MIESNHRVLVMNHSEPAGPLAPKNVPLAELMYAGLPFKMFRLDKSRTKVPVHNEVDVDTKL